MHELRICQRCRLPAEIACRCTTEERLNYFNEQVKGFERQQSKGSWSDNEMINYLRSQGYVIEKSRANPKKRKKNQQHKAK